MQYLAVFTCLLIVGVHGSIPYGRGPPGPKGPPGPPGQCACDPDEIEELRAAIYELRDSYCSVGIKERRVRDEHITASSMWDANHGPSAARLDNRVSTGSGFSTGAWSARHNRVGEWIQVDLLRPTYLTKIITQGRPHAYHQWVTSYKISYGYSPDHLHVLTDKHENEITFNGNTDKESYVTNKFPQPITARYVRILPQAWNRHISLRFELLTC